MTNTTTTKETKTRIECINPILRVKDISVSLEYYEKILGFKRADWVHSGATFAFVSRDNLGIYLCQNDQGQLGTWIWMGVEDVESFYNEYKSKGAKICQELTNYIWAYEMRVQDPDGHILRIGSEPRKDKPFVN